MPSAFIRAGQQFATKPLCGITRGAARVGRLRWVSRVEQRSRKLEAACFMRYALCSATDQLLSMLRRWILKAANDAMREVEVILFDPKARLREFASAVKAVALDAALSREDLGERLCELADQALDQRTPAPA